MKPVLSEVSAKDKRSIEIKSIGVRGKMNISDAASVLQTCAPPRGRVVSVCPIDVVRRNRSSIQCPPNYSVCDTENPGIGHIFKLRCRAAPPLRKMVIRRPAFGCVRGSGRGRLHVCGKEIMGDISLVVLHGWGDRSDKNIALGGESSSLVLSSFIYVCGGFPFRARRGWNCYTWNYQPIRAAVVLLENSNCCPDRFYFAIEVSQ